MARSRLPAHIRALLPADQQPKRRIAQSDNSGGAGILARAGVGSLLELGLLHRMLRAGLPEPMKQYPFAPGRKWHADFAYPSARLLIEVDGGSWSGGRHTRGQGFENDCEKLSTAAGLGWRVVRVTGRQIEDGSALRWIVAALSTTPAPDGQQEGG